MIRKLYFIDVDTVDHEIAHIFEHVFYCEFLIFMRERWPNREPWGWAEAETFQNVIFFTLNCYDQEAEKLFDKFRESFELDNDVLKSEIHVIESEEKILIKENFDDIVERLKVFAGKKFIGVNDVRGVIHYADRELKTLLKKRASPRSFENSSIDFTAENLTMNELAIFALLSGIVLDRLDLIMRRFGGSFAGDWLDDRAKTHGATLETEYVMRKKSYSIAKITDSIKRDMRLAEFSDKTVRNLLKGESPSSLIHYFRRTGIIFSPEDLVSMFTAENVTAVWAKIELKLVEKAE